MSDERDLAVDGTLEDTGDVAKTLATGEGPAIGKMAAVSMRRRPDAELLALWLADAVLATASDRRAADCRPIRRSDLGVAAYDHDRPQQPPFVRTFGRDWRSA